MKVSELEWDRLDYWVAKAQGWTEKLNGWLDGEGAWHNKSCWDPSEDWQDCGPLIEKYIQNIEMLWDGRWEAISQADLNGYIGDTPQEAICRAVVASVYGDEVDERCKII